MQLCVGGFTWVDSAASHVSTPRGSSPPQRHSTWRSHHTFPTATPLASDTSKNNIQDVTHSSRSTSIPAIGTSLHVIYYMVTPCASIQSRYRACDQPHTATYTSSKFDSSPVRKSCFLVSGPIAWNCLPESICRSQASDCSISTKSHLFSQNNDQHFMNARPTCPETDLFVYVVGAKQFICIVLYGLQAHIVKYNLHVAIRYELIINEHFNALYCKIQYNSAQYRYRHIASEPEGERMLQQRVVRSMPASRPPSRRIWPPPPKKMMAPKFRQK